VNRKKAIHTAHIFRTIGGGSALSPEKYGPD
jgi:hypothetical protein